MAMGLGLTVVIGAVAAFVWGGSGAVGAVAFGVLATAVQTAAVASVQPARTAPLPVFMRQWGIGMGFRLLGIVAFAVAVALRPEVFQPIPSALGYLGVVIPLLFAETRSLR